jgi:hypothetical protein
MDAWLKVLLLLCAVERPQDEDDQMYMSDESLLGLGSLGFDACFSALCLPCGRVGLWLMVLWAV